MHICACEGRMMKHPDTKHTKKSCDVFVKDTKSRVSIHSGKQKILTSKKSLQVQKKDLIACADEYVKVKLPKNFGKMKGEKRHTHKWGGWKQSLEFPKMMFRNCEDIECSTTSKYTPREKVFSEVIARTKALDAKREVRECKGKDCEIEPKWNYMFD